MKFVTIIFLTISFVTFQTLAFSQDATSKIQISNDLLEKSKRQKTTAWVLMGTGGAAFVYGIAGFSRGFLDFDSDERGPFQIHGIALGYGLLAPLVSIPFFIKSGQNKRKANEVLVFQPVWMQQPFGQGAPGIRVTWQVGK